MHTLKVAVLLLLTLAVMRLLSWLFGWLFSRIARRTNFWTSLAANAAALGVFAGFLYVTLMPGEPFDFGAFAFGCIVYAACLAIDGVWYPWKKRPPPDVLAR